MGMKDYSWAKYFIPPFHTDEFCTDIIWDSADNMTTTSSSEAASKGTAAAHFQALAAAMNAKMNGTELPAKMSFGHPVYEGTMSDSIVRFKADGEEIELNVRGWGFLTGGKRLDPNVAAAIQDEYGQFIVDCMNSINTDAET